MKVSCGDGAARIGILSYFEPIFGLNHFRRMPWTPQMAGQLFRLEADQGQRSHYIGSGRRTWRENKYLTKLPNQSLCLLENGCILENGFWRCYVDFPGTQTLGLVAELRKWPARDISVSLGCRSDRRSGRDRWEHFPIIINEGHGPRSASLNDLAARSIYRRKTPSRISPRLM